LFGGLVAPVKSPGSAPGFPGGDVAGQGEGSGVPVRTKVITRSWRGPRPRRGGRPRAGLGACGVVAPALFGAGERRRSLGGGWRWAGDGGRALRIARGV